MSVPAGALATSDLFRLPTGWPCGLDRYRASHILRGTVHSAALLV